MQSDKNPAPSTLRPSIYVIMDNLFAHKGAKIRRWAWKTKVALCFTPTNAS